MALAERRESLATFEDVPFEGHSFSVAQFRDMLAAEAIRPLKLTAFPWWMMRVLSPVWELARELMEMRYLWVTPHRLSGEKLARLVPEYRPTPVGEVVRAALRASSGDVRPDDPVRAGGKPVLAQ